MASSEDIKVLHYEHNGVGVILSEALREQGIESRVLASGIHLFGFKEDFLLLSTPLWPRSVWTKLLRPFLWRKYYDGYDILHNHCQRHVPDYILKHWKGRVIQHYHDPSVRSPLIPDALSFASLPTFLKVIPGAVWMPIPVHTKFFSPSNGSKQHESVNVGYCKQTTDPSKPSLIPEREINAAVERSKGTLRGHPIEGIVPHGSMPGYYGGLDVWVDRIGLHFYGFAAVEAASMGIPVIAEMGEEELNVVSDLYHTDCPFLNVKSAKEVPEALLSLAQDEGLRRELGEKARKYALEVHDSMKVARRCKEQYESLKG